MTHADASADATTATIEQLRARVEQLELVLQATEEGLFEWDILTGEVYYSPRWKAMLGYADDEFPNTTDEWQQRVHPDDLERSLRMVRVYLQGERATCEFEHRLRHKDGTYRWFFERAVAKRDAEGQPLRLVGSQADITDRKEAEDEVRRRDAILEAVRIGTERFLRRAVSWDENIGDLLAIFGEALGVSRVYVFENGIDAEGVLRCYQRHEWAAAGVGPLVSPDADPAIPFGDSGWHRWKDLLARGDPVVGRTRDFPADEQAELQREGTLSLVMVPIFVDEAWWGFIGFDDCARERVWSSVEVDALKAAAGTLGAAIGRQRADAVSARRDAVLEAVRYAGERFLKPGATWQERAHDVLERLGQATGVSRTYVSMNEPNTEGELCNSVIHEWKLPGIEPWAGNPRYQAIPIIRSGLGRWMETLQRGEMMYGHVRDIVQSELPADGASTRSFVSVPIFVDGAWWGAIGFDESRREREFSAPERDALKAAADTLGAAIQRDRAEAAAARLAAIVESTNDAIFGMLRNGTITSWNAGAERLYGYTEAETVGRRIHDLISPADLDRVREVLVALTAGEQADQVEAEVTRKDGKRIWVALTFSMLRDAAGTVTGTSAIGRDISARKRAEAELAQRDAILEAVRFAAERFLGPETTWEEAVQDVLERLGRATGVCQVYVARNRLDEAGEVWASDVHQWAVAGVPGPGARGYPGGLPLRAVGLDHLVDRFRRGEAVYGHSRDFPAAARAHAEVQGVRSWAIVPIFVEGAWWGQIGFDECEGEREFSASERDALKAAADTLGAAISREMAEQRNAWLAAIVESSDDAIVGRTLDNTIVSWNQGAERLYGYGAEEVIGSNVEVLLPPEEREPMARIVEAVRRGEHVTHYETERMHRNGERLMVSVSYSPVRNRAGEVIGLAASSRDISARKRAEAELRESQRSLRTLLSNLPGVAYRRRYHDGWEIDFFSEGSFALSGYHPSDFIGPNRVDTASITHPDDRARTQSEVDVAVAKDEPFQVTYRIRTATGVEKWVLDQGRGVRDEAGRLVAIEGIITDVTDRVLARQELERRVEERTRELSTLLNLSTSIASTLELRLLLGQILDQYGQVVDYLAAAIFLLDGETHLRALDYRGPLSPEEIVWTWSLAEVAHSRAVITSRAPVIIPDIRADTPLAAAFRAKAISDLGEVPNYVRSWMGVPLIFRGQVIGLLAVDSAEVDAYSARDAELAMAFASQVAVAIANARLYEQAQGTAALEERQRLARELHDSVSQALFGIGLGARTARTLLDEDPAKAAAPLDYVLSLAEAGLTEMRALIFELRPEALEQEGLVAALEKQVANLRARHGIEVVAALGDPGDVTLAVEEAIYRIAQEALNNTVKHARATEVRIRLRREPGRLVAEIADNGAGFDPGGSFSGHLGLRTMRERAERLGGNVEIASAPGKGTRLRVSIPI